MLFQQKGKSFDFTKESYDLLRACITFSVENRTTAEAALDMPFFKLKIPN